MRKLFVLAISLVITLSITSLQVQALEVNLGDAAKYNAFIKDDFSITGSDIQGRMAVGGDFKVSGQYDVGVKINSFGMGDGPSIIVGGNVVKTGTGHLNIFGENGAANSGDLVYAGTISGSVVDGNEVKTAEKNLPVDFDNAFSYLEQLSDDLMAKTASGSTTQNGWYLDFVSTEKTADNVYVFNVTQAQAKSGGWNVNGVSDNATIVFNIIGSGKVSLSNYIDLSINGKSISDSFNQDNLAGRSNQQVLFNFANAAELDLKTTLYGSVLAPSADISASTQPIWGQVIAKSWDSSNAQINYNPFSPVGKPTAAVDVPEPATVWLFLLAFLYMFARQQKFSFSFLGIIKNQKQLVAAF